MRYDIVFIIAGLICLLLGEGLGMYMGANLDFTLSPVHAHLNLVGWVTLALYGVLHRAFPALARSRLAMPQCILAVLGAATLPVGIALTVLNINHLFVILASLVVMLGTLAFLIMFARKAAASGAPA